MKHHTEEFRVLSKMLKMSGYSERWCSTSIIINLHEATDVFINSKLHVHCALIKVVLTPYSKQFQNYQFFHMMHFCMLFMTYYYPVWWFVKCPLLTSILLSATET